MIRHRKADPYCRLRVPKYQKVFEAAFFAIFLALYYAVLVERNPHYITVVEVFLYIWISAFACDGFSDFRDAGSLLYSTDFWSLWDVGIIGTGGTFLILRESLDPHQRDSESWHRLSGQATCSTARAGELTENVAP